MNRLDILKRGLGTLLIAVLAMGVSGPSANAAAKINIAVLMGSTSNAYQAASLDAAKKQAKLMGNVNLTVFDGAFDPSKQLGQLENVISLGKAKFQAVLIFPIDNNNLIAGTKAALAAGIKVGASDGIIGPLLNTEKLQVPGISVQVGPVWSAYGKRIATMTGLACKGINPCNIIFTKGLSAWGPEAEFRSSFMKGIASSSNIKVIAEPGDTGYSRDGGLKVIGDAITANAKASVIIAADQAILGATSALVDAGLIGKVKLIGIGGTVQAVAGVKDGTWFGTIGQAPAYEGKMGVKGIVDHIRTGKALGGIDSQVSIVNNALITKAFASQFKPEFSG